MDSELDKPATFFRFEDLRIYHKALEFVDWIYSLARGSMEAPYAKPFFERFLTSANGIAIHIAEGSSRNKSQFIYYLKMAKSSVRECVVIASTAQSQGFISASEFEESKNRMMEMTKMIGALIGSLQRSVRPDELDDDDLPD
jgi:four helix bundle protein